MRAAFAARIYFVIRRRHFAASGVVKYTRIADGQSRRAGRRAALQHANILWFLPSKALYAADGEAPALIVLRSADGTGYGVRIDQAAALFDNHELGLCLVRVIQEHDRVTGVQVDYIAGAKIRPILHGYIVICIGDGSRIIGPVGGFRPPDRL